MPSVTLEQSWAGWHLGSGQEFVSLERASPPLLGCSAPLLEGVGREPSTTHSLSEPRQWNGDVLSAGHWGIRESWIQLPHWAAPL